jgi:hypothetical protein
VIQNDEGNHLAVNPTVVNQVNQGYLGARTNSATNNFNTVAGNLTQLSVTSYGESGAPFHFIIMLFVFTF